MASKAKSKSKSKSSVKSRNELPAGFKPLDPRGAQWDFESQKVLRGVRGKVKELTLKRGTPDEYETRVLNITESGTKKVYSVWDSATLAGLFDDVDEGSEVIIEFTGYGTAKPGMNRPKLFQVSVAE